MRTVFLVEDEEAVRERVRKLIPWEQLGFRLAGEAGDGEEALERIMQLKPDLIISDIVMPIMDGIELLQHVRRAGLDSQFVMLTCMNEFEYARQALEYGAFSYVLKLSMTVEQMRQLLLKVRAKLDERDSLQAQLAAGPFLRHYGQLWERMFGQDKQPAAPEAAPQFQGKANRRVTIVAALAGGEAERYARSVPRDENGDPLPLQAHAYVKAGIATWFLWREAGREREPRDEACIAAWAATLPDAVRTEAADAADLPRQWRQALRKLDAVWYGEAAGSAGIAVGASAGAAAAAAAPAGRQTIAWPQERELFQAFEEMKAGEFRRQLAGIWADMAQAAVPSVQVKQTAERLLATFDRIVGRTEPGPFDTDRFRTHGELLAWLQAEGERRLNETIEAHSRFTDHPEINKIVHYIRLHYHTDITLESMAKYAAMDKHYLSGLFRRKTGDTLIHFVHKTRLEHAARLLASTDLSLGEIAERVGIASDNYLIKLFKKGYDMTPAEYKRRCAAGER
ncbi:MAG: response regulator [Paenibacillaceae bacterium]|nr:response regulator [Paenibacillaceae bacterium]